VKHTLDWGGKKKTERRPREQLRAAKRAEETDFPIKNRGTTGPQNLGWAETVASREIESKKKK